MNLDRRDLQHALFEYIGELDKWACAQGIQCLRKVVGCGVLSLGYKDDQPILTEVVRTTSVRTTNGPTLGHTCTAERGNCGCAHAEPKAVLTVMNVLNRDLKLVLCCNYSPCTRCAHVIINAHDMFGAIDAVAYRHLTEHDQRGAALLEKAGLTVVQVHQ